MDVDVQDVLCNACHQGTLIWDSDTYSLVCSACGATNDSPQLVHDSGFDTGQLFRETITQSIGPRRQYSTLVKDANWYEQSNKRDCHQTIKNICAALEYSGDVRATQYFDMVIQKERENGQLRWGQQAKLEAAACVAVAMTESKRAEAIAQIAGLMGESLPSVLRMWSRVTALLDIRVRPIDPILLVASLHDYIRDVLRSEQPVPFTVRNTLNQPFLSMELAQNTAEHIGSFLARINAFREVPGGPTACAIVIVGIEAEFGHSFPPPVLIAIEKWLGERLNAPFTAIDDRRRAILVIFNDMARHIPWVLLPANNEESGQFLSMNRVSAIIRAVKDVLKFQNELLTETSIPSYSLGQAPDDTTLESFPLNPPHVERDVNGERVSLLTNKSTLTVDSRYRGARKPYGAQAAQRMISQMLDPRFDQKLRAETLADREDLRDYLSRVEIQVLSQSEKPLSRLQALSLQRGGEIFVTEDELFEPGELESYQNTDEVARLLADSHPEWDTTPRRIKASAAQPKKSKARNMPLPGQVSYSDMESDDSDGVDEGGGEGDDSDIDARSLNESRNIDESEDTHEKYVAEEMNLDIDLRNDPQMAMGLFGLYADGEHDFSIEEEITDNLFPNRQ